MKTYQLLGGRVAAQRNTPPPVAAAEALHRGSGFQPAEQQSQRYSPLSINQFKRLGLLARQAWDSEVKAGRIAVSANLTKTQQFEDWRHEQQFLACGVRSLKACDQRHYRSLRAHWQSLIGTPESVTRAFNNRMRTGKVSDTAPEEDTHEARELWLAKIREAVQEFHPHISLNYVEAICRNQYRCPLSAANPKQLKDLHSTARSRGRAKQAKADGARKMDEFEDRPF